MDDTRRRLPVVGEGAESAAPGGTVDAHARTLSRRAAIKAMAAAAALPAVGAGACAPGDAGSGGATASRATNPLATGTATDPDLVAPVVPWDGVLTDAELRTTQVLCDLIIPADERSPSASQVGVVEFIDEWIGAPYPANERDRTRIRGGLLWLDTEANERFGTPFADLDEARMRQICDDIRHVPDARPEHRAAALFFDRFRDLTSSGFWTTDEGMADLGYVGNVPLERFDGPPPEVLERLGLA